MWAHTPVWPTPSNWSSPCLTHGFIDHHTVLLCARVIRARPGSSITWPCSVARPTTRAVTRPCDVD
ncbi:hypothetical protein J1N35_014751, partial [Gossypium stocksii]